MHDRPRATTFRGFQRTAHLMSTRPGAAGSAELLAFAVKIGLKAAWIQYPGTPREHFDLFDGKIEQAVAAGSVEVHPRILVERVVRPKREGAAAKLDKGDG